MNNDNIKKIIKILSKIKKDYQPKNTYEEVARIKNALYDSRGRLDLVIYLESSAEGRRLQVRREDENGFAVGVTEIIPFLVWREHIWEVLLRY